MAPKVSVILPVYNGEMVVKEAITGILQQTHTDFEFIIINDGSKDNSERIIKEFNDPRIVFRSQNNIGLAGTLNLGIHLAQGEFIARQDQDDISLPQRLERQVKFFQKNPEYSLVGSWTKIISEQGRERGGHTHPTENCQIKFFSLFDCYFVHSSVMMKKKIFSKVGTYSIDKLRQPPEDYELWSRVLRQFLVANMPEVLLIYREFPTSMSRDKAGAFLENVKIISRENIAFYSGMDKNSHAVNTLVEIHHSPRLELFDSISFSEIERVLWKAAQGIMRICPEKSKNCLVSSVNQFLSKKWPYYSRNSYGSFAGRAFSFIERNLPDKMKMRFRKVI